MNLTPAERHRLVQALTELEELSNKHAQLSDELEQIAIRRQENASVIKSLLGKLDSESLLRMIRSDFNGSPDEHLLSQIFSLFLKTIQRDFNDGRPVPPIPQPDIVFRGAFSLRDLTFLRDSTL
jgi:F0F1-type ATP synthase delta subunit